ncbi:MAG: HEAT repeat domain-containing protein [Dehalococcoidales bacterium]|nr:HEAT repeat domain-containing protein [Dehalococcoidales bacterium]
MLVKDIINEMADTGKALVNSHLADLSQISPANLKYFTEVWKTIELKRRREIITRLAELITDSVELNFDTIFKSCLTDPDADIRSEAINGLWENEDPSLISSFIDLLNKDPSEKVQASAALALGRFALMAELGSIRPRYGVLIGQVLLAVTEDKSKSIEVRRRALEAVAPLSTEQIKLAIRKSYESRDERLAISAVYAMGRNCDTNWLPTVLKELNNHDAEMRYEAVCAIGEIGDEDTIQHLLPLTDDTDIDVRMAAVQALGKIGGNEAKQHLQKNANDPNEAVREAIEQALNEISIQDDMTIFQMAPPPGEHED